MFVNKQENSKKQAENKQKVQGVSLRSPFKPSFALTSSLTMICLKVRLETNPKSNNKKRKKFEGLVPNCNVLIIKLETFQVMRSAFSTDRMRTKGKNEKDKPKASLNHNFRFWPCSSRISRII